MLPAHLNWIRAQFPALNQHIHGQPAIFLDGPGGTQVTSGVIEAMHDYFVQSNANAHGVFATSLKTDALIVEARSAVADFLGCDQQQIVFGPNMTTLTFAVSRAMARNWGQGDEIVVTRLDHDANIAPWLALANRGIRIRWVDVNLEDCTLDMAELERLITPKTKLVAIGYASNAIGTVNNVAQIVKLAHSVGALVFVDAVHYAPHASIDARRLDCDFLTCSAYKFFGPHIGILYGKQEHLSHMLPFKVRPASDESPMCWETGTLNHEGLAGLVAAIEYLEILGRRLSPIVQHRRAALQVAMNASHQYGQDLCQSLLTGLLRIPGVTVYGITDINRLDWRLPTVGLRIAGVTPKTVAQRLGECGIFVWHGNFYALELTKRLGIENTGGLVRIGMVHYNTLQEVKRVLQVLEEMATSLAMA